MNLLGTTGTRSTRGRERELTEYLLRPETGLWLAGFDGYVSGGCRGWDAIFGRTLALTYPDKIHCVIVPDNRSQVDPWWEEFDLGKIWVIFMGEGTDFRARNQKIVELSSYIWYCASHPEKHGASTRSGTWMTVRLARAADKPVSGFLLN